MKLKKETAWSSYLSERSHPPFPPSLERLEKIAELAVGELKNDGMSELVNQSYYVLRDYLMKTYKQVYEFHPKHFRFDRTLYLQILPSEALLLLHMVSARAQNVSVELPADSLRIQGLLKEIDTALGGGQDPGPAGEESGEAARRLAEANQQAGDILAKAEQQRKAIIEDAEAQRRAIVEEAEAQKETILSGAQEQAQSIHLNAKKQAEARRAELRQAGQPAPALEQQTSALRQEQQHQEQQLLEQVEQIRATLQSVSTMAKTVEAAVSDASVRKACTQLLELYNLIADVRDNAQGASAAMAGNMTAFLDMLVEYLSDYGIRAVVTPPGSPFQGKYHDVCDTTDFDPKKAVIKESLRAGFVWREQTLQKERVVLQSKKR